MKRIFFATFAVLVFLISHATPQYKVSVRPINGKWEEIKVYPWKVAHVVQAKQTNEESSVAAFEMGQPMEIVVEVLDRTIRSARIRPMSYDIPFTQQANKICFTLDRPRYLSIEVNGDIYHNLQLFADSVMPKVKKRKNVIYFAPGYHEIKDSLKVESGQTVYLAAGAYVKGYISVWNAQNVKILGTGIVNPERQQEGIMVRYSKNVEINGPLTTQIPVGGSENVRVSNAKVISWYGWGDGMNVFASNHVAYNHVFCRTSDDCSTIYCTRKGYHGGCSDIRIHDAIYWADVAHPIMIGLHGDIDKNEEIKDVVYDDIDILQQNEKQIDYQGCIGINNGDNILVRDILFSNIRVESLSCGMLFNMRVCYNKKYCHAPGRGIENITFRNITYTGREPNMSIITGYNEERKVKNVRFEKLVINGLHIADDMKMKPTWYKTSDFANMFVGEHVENVEFK
ncbi:endo-polygalacturonase [Hallella bergensis]|uniref:endo-polygalacturonase n=1 Tax=Hallella bergensis TaxID=242750 RepID=UPI003990B6ED